MLSIYKIISKVFRKIYTAYKSKKEIIKQKRPQASDKANPKIAWGNNVERNDGLRDVPLIKATNTKAIPIAAPPNPNVAIAAPMYFAANANCILNIFLYL